MNGGLCVKHRQWASMSPENHLGHTAAEETRLLREIARKRSVKDAVKVTEEVAPELPPLRVVKTSSRTQQKSGQPAPQSGTTRSAPRIRTVSTEVPATDPVDVLARLYTFRDNIARALEKKPCYSRRNKPPQLPFVAKWVDYSRKYGVGYVLDDGTLGCLTTATDVYPVTSAFSTNGLRHLKELSKDQAYIEDIPLQFYAAPQKTKGTYRIALTEARRINDIRLYWQKFARYMCLQLGDEDWPKKDDAERPNFVKFYQRLGNVGIWNFDDGSFQVSK